MVAAANEITFLVFKIEKDTAKNKIVLISKTATTGKIKKVRQKPLSENYLMVETYYNGTLNETSYTEHPLFKTVEYTDEQNRLASKYVEPDTGEFFIRLQTKTGQTTVRIYETVKNNPNTELLTLTL